MRGPGHRFADKKKAGVGTARVYDLIRRHVPALTEDRPPSEDIERISQLILNGDIRILFDE